jgi:hypothetical protein
MDTTDLRPRLVKIPKAAEMLGISRSQVYLLVASGALTRVHQGAAALITVESIDAHVTRLVAESLSACEPDVRAA